MADVIVMGGSEPAVSALEYWPRESRVASPNLRSEAETAEDNACDKAHDKVVRVHPPDPHGTPSCAGVMSAGALAKEEA